MSNEKNQVDSGLNRAKMYQLALFPMNNGATNVYFVLILSYIATFGNTVIIEVANKVAIANTVLPKVAIYDKINTKYTFVAPLFIGNNAS